MNASAPLNIQSLKQTTAMAVNDKVQSTSSIINVNDKRPNNTRITNTMGTLNATDIYSINSKNIARTTQNQRISS